MTCRIHLGLIINSFPSFSVALKQLYLFNSCPQHLMNSVISNNYSWQEVNIRTSPGHCISCMVVMSLDVLIEVQHVVVWQIQSIPIIIALPHNNDCQIQVLQILSYTFLHLLHRWSPLLGFNLYQLKYKNQRQHINYLKCF